MMKCPSIQDTQLIWLLLVLLQQNRTFASSMRYRKNTEQKTANRGFNHSSSSSNHGGHVDMKDDNDIGPSLRSSSNNAIRERSLDILNHLYRINAPKQFGCDGTYSFFLRFDLSDYISNEKISLQMFRLDENNECTVDITDNQYVKPSLVFDDSPCGDGTCTRQVAAYFEVDPNLLPFSDIYYVPEGGQAYIHYCIRLNIFSESDENLVTWRDIEFSQNVQFTSGFLTRRALTMEPPQLRSETQKMSTITADVPTKYRIRSNEVSSLMKREQVDASTTSNLIENPHRHRHLIECSYPFYEDVLFDGGSFCGEEGIPVEEIPVEGTQAPTLAMEEDGDGWTFVMGPTEPMELEKGTGSVEASNGYGVLAYICDGELEPVETSETDLSAQAGPVIRVCVERNENAVRDGLYIRHISAFTYFRGNGLQQKAVALVGKEANNGLTELYCAQGFHKCWFETYLVPDFFLSEGYVQGSGVAALQFGDGSRKRSRRLHSEKTAAATMERELQDEEEVISNSLPFQLEFLAIPKEDFNPFEYTGKTKKDKQLIRYGMGAVVLAVCCVMYLELSKRWKQNRKESSTLPRTTSKTKSSGKQGDSPPTSCTESRASFEDGHDGNNVHDDDDGNASLSGLGVRRTDSVDLFLSGYEMPTIDEVDD